MSESLHVAVKTYLY